MTAIQEAPSLEQPLDILANCRKHNPQDDAYLRHPVINLFGSPEQSIYIDELTVNLNGIQYEQPLILPVHNAQLELVQCAVLQNQQPVKVIPDGMEKGFAYYGELQKDHPVIITYSLEAFFKIAQTSYAVVLVILQDLCRQPLKELKAFDFEQIQSVVNQLSKAGYKGLYMPVRAEHIQLEPFQRLEQHTELRLLNQFQLIGEKEYLTELSQDEDALEIEAFLQDAIALLPEQYSLPKGHIAKPMKWEKGYFHIKQDGIFFVDEDSKGDSHTRFICSPILVKAKTRDNASNNWGVLLEWHDDKQVKHTQAVAMELFQTDGKELRTTLANQGVRIASDQRGRNLFQCYLMNYPIEQYALCVDRVGWHGDVFVLPHQHYGQMNEHIVYQSVTGLDNRYKSKGTLEQWRSQVAQLVEQHSFLVFALCTAFAGQLLRPLQQQGCGFHFKGGSSKGKSTALNLACSVWGNPEQFYRTWRATGNALEHTAYMHNDSFLVLDEIGEITHPKELGNIVYMLANGIGKGRMTKQITAKPMYQWKVIFLSSGEKSMKEIMLEQGQKTKLGQEIRLADIDIDQSQYGVFDCINFAEDGAKQAIELSQRMNDCYGVASEAWLDYLSNNKPERMEQAKQLLNQYRESLVGEHTQGHISRVANYFAVVAVAGELATHAKITGWQSGTTFNAVAKVFQHWLSGFEHVGDYENREILAHVKAFFEANESSRFEAITPDADNIERVVNRVGYWKIEKNEKIFYVLPEQFKKEVCKGYDSRKVAKVLMEHDLLEHDTAKKTKTVRLPNRSQSIRVYAIKDLIFSCNMDNS